MEQGETVKRVKLKFLKIYRGGSTYVGVQGKISTEIGTGELNL